MGRHFRVELRCNITYHENRSVVKIKNDETLVLKCGYEVDKSNRKKGTILRFAVEKKFKRKCHFSSLKFEREAEGKVHFFEHFVMPD